MESLRQRLNGRQDHADRHAQHMIMASDNFKKLTEILLYEPHGYQKYVKVSEAYRELSENFKMLSEDHENDDYLLKKLEDISRDFEEISNHMKNKLK